MTIYEALYKRARPISIAAGLYLVAIIATRFLIPKDKFQLVALGLLALFAALVWITAKSMQCPKCKHSLGLLVFHAGKPPAGTDRVMFCPYCGISLNESKD